MRNSHALQSRINLLKLEYNPELKVKILKEKRRDIKNPAFSCYYEYAVYQMIGSGTSSPWHSMQLSCVVMP